jgi:hypothetical protein
MELGVFPEIRDEARLAWERVQEEQKWVPSKVAGYGILGALD